MHNIICNDMFFSAQTWNNLKIIFCGMFTGMMFNNYLSGVGADYFVFFPRAGANENLTGSAKLPTSMGTP